MSREMDTSVTIEGTPDQLFAMLKTLQSFETDWQKQYWELAHSKRVGAELDHGYLENVHSVRKNKGKYTTYTFRNMTDDELRAFVAEAGASIEVFADGPIGSFYEPGELGLFETLAEAAPDAAFSGRITGIAWGAEFRHTAELKDGHLELDDRVYDGEDSEYYQEEYYDTDEED